MRRTLFLLGFVVLAGCSQAKNDAYSREAASDAAVTPDVNVPTTPGVAFAYRYRFQLPPAKVATAQEQHQQACERLGLARCRITGWQYRVVGENDVEGSLTFLLDPMIARTFGKDAAGVVAQQNGVLKDAEITGTNVADVIASARAGKATEQTEIDRIDRALSRANVKSQERAELQAQRAAATNRARAARVNVENGQERLSLTPITFDYRSGPAIRGFDASAPIASAADLLIGSAQITFALILSATALVGSPALALLLTWLAFQAMRKGFRRASQPAQA